LAQCQTALTINGTEHRCDKQGDHPGLHRTPAWGTVVEWPGDVADIEILSDVLNGKQIHIRTRRLKRVR
jgi:hypothetical protein